MTEELFAIDRTTTRNPSWPPGEADRLSQVDRLLRDGRPQEALSLVATAASTWGRNARAVCLLRLGRPREAVEVLREIVFNPTGFAIRPDADPVFQANYATALLLDGNPDGFWSILGGIKDRDNPAVARLDAAVHRWKGGMSLWQRIATTLGVGGPRFALDSPPGDL